MWNNISFANPEFLFLLLIIPLFIVWYILKGRKKHVQVPISSHAYLKKAKKSWRDVLKHFLFALQMLALALMIVAFARPQTSLSKQTESIKGIDIVMSLDVSSSMLAEDLKPNRLDAAKKVAINFIKGRPNDKIGLVVFSAEAFTQSPLTTDHPKVISLFDKIKAGELLEDGTAIGDGLATAINRLKESTAISKVIILLTDGENNRGYIDPISAAEIAQLYNIRIYTIGVGKNGMAPYPRQGFFGKQYQQVEVKIDEKLLKNIAKMTKGKYYRATNNKSLKQIYDKIDLLERSKIKVTRFQEKTEEFLPLLLFALGLLVFEFLLRHMALKRLF